MAAIVAAVAIGVVDLYLVGHGRGSLLRESISWPAAGVYLSIGDIVMLCLVVAAAILAWALVGRVVRRS
jgi:hypothetical protein